VKALVLAALPLASALAAGAVRATPPTPVKKAVIVAAPPAAVWAAWTTVEGATSFFAPGARIDARPGGPYEIWFFPEAPAGDRGCDGCTVISVDPPKRIAFTWSFPPSIPELRARNTTARVAVELLPASVDGATLVSLVHDGFPEGEAGEKGRAYFEKAWDTVLARLQQRFRSGPVDWTKR
jgi:uncharacterized protein YndB with AHSA1/START domain